MAPEALRAELEATGSGLAPAEWARLARLLDAWRDLRAVRDRLSLAELLSRAVDALDLDAALLAAPDGERRMVNLEKAITLAARFEADGGRAPELAGHLRALAARPPREPEADLEAEDAVSILSVHQAKGLEWPVVLVPDLGALARHDGRRALLDDAGRLCASFFDAAREEHVETAAIRRARDGSSSPARRVGEGRAGAGSSTREWRRARTSPPRRPLQRSAAPPRGRVSPCASRSPRPERSCPRLRSRRARRRRLAPPRPPRRRACRRRRRSRPSAPR
jgi:superfamily I DNA/RNA helicase